MTQNCKSPNFETEIYKTYLDHMNKNESNVLKFLFTIVSAFGVFFYAAVKNLPSTENSNMLLSAAIISNIILLWGILYTLSMSYTHRYIQIIMTKYEWKNNLIRIEKWNPLKWREEWLKEPLYKCVIATSPYQIHILGFLASIIAIWFSYYYFTINLDSTILIIIVFWENLLFIDLYNNFNLGIVCFSIIFSLLIVRHTIRHYRTKILKLIDKEKKTLEYLNNNYSSENCNSIIQIGR